MASLNGTLIIRPDVSLTDNAGNAWTFHDGQVYENGVLDALTNRVVAIGFINGQVVQQNTDNLWWAKTGQGYDDWGTPGYADGHIAEPFAASVSGKTITPDSVSPIVDGSGNLWWISGGKVVENGIADTLTGGVIEMAYVNGQIYQENNNWLWWQKTYQGWGGWGTPGNPDGHISSYDVGVAFNSWSWIGGGDNDAANPVNWAPDSVPQPGANSMIFMSSGIMDLTNNPLDGAAICITGTSYQTTGLTTTINVFGENHFSLHEGYPYPQPAATVNLAANAKWIGGFSGSPYGPGVVVQGDGQFANTFSGTGNNSVVINASVVGSGTFDVSSYRGSGRLEFMRSVSSDQSVNVHSEIYYAGGTFFSTLQIDQPSTFAAGVTLGYGEVVLKGLVADSFSFKDDLLSLYANGGVVDSLRLKLDGNLGYDTSGRSGAQDFGVSQVGGDVVVHADENYYGQHAWASGAALPMVG